jgi:hypothetical protein
MPTCTAARRSDWLAATRRAAESMRLSEVLAAVEREGAAR